MYFTLDMVIVWAFVSVLAVIALDTLLGIMLAVSKSEFDPRKLPEFLRSNLLPYAGALMLLAIGAMSLDVIKALYFPSVAAANYKFLTEIKDKLVDVFGNDIKFDD